MVQYNSDMTNRPTLQREKKINIEELNIFGIQREKKV